MLSILDPFRRWVLSLWRLVLPLVQVVTSLGWGVLAAAVLAWVVSVRSGWTELSLVATAGLAVFLLALVFTLGRALVTVEFALDPQRVTVGSPAAGQVRITNAAHGRLFPLRLELPVGAATALFDVPSLGRGETHEELFVVPTQRRAVIPVGPARTVRGDPLGLLRRGVQWTGVTELFVHPKISLLDPLAAGFLRDLEGQSTNDMSMSDLAFHTLRDYSPGDDRRYVHWRSTARTGRLLVRQFVDTRRSHVAVVIDSSASNYLSADDLELAISVGGSVAVRALRDEQDATVAVGGLILNGRSPQLILDELARVQAEPLDVAAAVRTLLARSPDISVAVLISGPQLGLASIRRAAVAFDSQVRVLACVVDPGARAGLARAGDVTVLTLTDLGELTRLLRVATRI